MKEYKPTYCMSLMTFCGDALFVLPAMAISISLIAMDEGGGFLPMIRYFVWVYLAIALALAVVTLVFNLIAKPLSKTSVTVTDLDVTHEGKTLRLSEIKYVSLHLAEHGKYNRSPQVLVLYVDDDRDLHIKRPSLRLIAQMKRDCRNASFKIENLGHKIKILLIASVILAAIMPLYVLIERK